MSEPPRPQEPTLPAERTRLAWQRTVLAGVVCLLGVLRLLAEVSIPVMAVGAIVTGLGGTFVVSASIRRSIRRRGLTSETNVGRNAALLAGLVSLACAGAMSYVILV